MIKKKVSLILVLVLLASLVPAALADGTYIAAEHTKSNGKPYYIMVNRKMNTVTVYTVGEDGYYSKPYKSMICSTGRQGHRTPLGTFSIVYRAKWIHMVDGTYGQYNSQFKGNYLFHSVCYSSASKSSLIAKEYNDLGSFASRGCVRLQTADAKWIYDNCADGTKVTIYDGDDPGPLGKPEKLVAEITPELDNGWDPTDPSEDNPWRERFVSSVSIAERLVSLNISEKTALTVTVSPDTAIFRDIAWTSSDPEIASVDENGQVIANSIGQAIITAACGDLTAACTVNVVGELPIYTDVSKSDWFYPDLVSAAETGLMSGTGDGCFSPKSGLTLAETSQLIYNLSGGNDAAEGEDWWSNAFNRAIESGIFEGMFSINSDPQSNVTRRELAVALYRYHTLVLKKYAATGDTANFTDCSELDAASERALGWAAASGLILGDGEGKLTPNAEVTRAEACAIIMRYSGLAK